MNNTEVFNTPVFVTNFTGNLTWWLCLCSATLVYNVLKSKFPEEVEHWRQKTPFRYLLPAPRDVPELLNEVIKGQENLVDVVSEFRDIGAKMLQVMIKENQKKNRRPSAPAKRKSRGRPPVTRSIEEGRRLERERQRVYRQGRRAGEEPEPATPANSSVLSPSFANSSSPAN